MSFSLAAMPWLPAAPADLRQQLKANRAEPASLGPHLRRAAAHRLDLNAAHAWTVALDAWLATAEGMAARPLTIGILSNGTTDFLRTALSPALMRHGVVARVVGAPFGQVAQQALDPRSTIHEAACAFVLLAIDHRGLSLPPSPGDEATATATVHAAIEQLRGFCQAFAARGAVPIVQTLPLLPDALFGSIDRGLAGTQAAMIDAFNQALRAQHAAWGCLLVDAASLAERVGLDAWHDAVQWATGKFLMAQHCVPVHSDWIARVVAAARGKSRKCLVLDLDNTVWGGVIGDDGLAGIVLGNGSAVGEAHLDVQQTALRLRERGVVLAVSSKNDDAVARTPFRDHPEMLLKEEHIAVFQANWRDKAANLRAIAETLNIGIDALVLLDDNPAERAQVRQALPEVGVPELSDDPAYFARTLTAAGYFEAVAYTADDRARAEQYRANAVRAALQGEAANLDDYLQSLDMEAHFLPFDAVGRARIVQLINKTNQFNLTTRRYTEAQVRAFEESATGLTFQIRLIDRFGDNGMISVIVCVAEDDDWLIDTWLMSCRVLNRKVEAATLDQLCARARARGVRRLIGDYVATGRNGMVAQHYERLGFTLERQDDGGSRWTLDVADHVPTALPMRIVGATAD